MSEEQKLKSAFQTPVDGDTNMSAASESQVAGHEVAHDLATSSQLANAVDSSLGATEAANCETLTDGEVATEASANQSTEDGTAEHVTSGMITEEDRLWGIVKMNSLDFDAWTALIEETEKTAGEKIWKIRKIYDEFLAEFPLCYGYWKKYADHEARLGSMDKVVEVYERAVLGVTYSVDIWLHYCTFFISTYGDPDTIRSLFERALAYVGTDYQSWTLWDKYIEYEEIQSDWSRVAMLYMRILEIPNRRLDDYLLRFKALAASRPLSDLKAEEVIGSVTEDLQPQHGNEKETKPNNSEELVEPVSVGLSESEELEKYVSVGEDIYKKAKELDSKICDFENSIRRPYFHVRPLNFAELENWHNYLTFIEREGDLNKVVKLYERCLIACANYHDYWTRYVLCMEACGSMEIANNALARATHVFVKRQPEIHLFAARFREKNGDSVGARAAYQLVHTHIAPGLVDAIVKHANMEHRVGNTKDAISLYQQAIAVEKGKENSQNLPILYVQYTRFLFLVCKDFEKAMEILSEVAENSHMSKPLLEAIIHFESIHPQRKRPDYINSLVDKFISENLHLPITEREELSYIFTEFLDMFGDAQSIARAEDRHNKIFLPHRTRSDVKKRHAEDYLLSGKSKLSKSNADGMAAMMSAYPNAQPQWQAVYGAGPPPAYAHQGGAYGAYGGYGGGAGGSPGSEAAAFATFSSSYSAHPDAHHDATSAQHPASLQQPYYGAYY